ncbi:MAG: hypothetical protein KAV99_00695 [Candidatus Latescibacteria bacterium]|nr:hypothetical protein [Candidatus Latescibacterota bacterium]
MGKHLPGLILVIIALSISGCGDKGAEPEKTAPELIAEGWQAYEARDYGGALSKFNEVVTKDATLADAYTGLGWTNAKLNVLSSAVTNFSQCLSLDPRNLDAKAGLAFVYNAQNEYSQSITKANEVLSIDPNWSFSHDNTLSSGDLHLLIAENYYALAEFENSLTEVRSFLNTSFAADVTTPEGRAALAAEIERLRGVV